MIDFRVPAIPLPMPMESPGSIMHQAMTILLLAGFLAGCGKERAHPKETFAKASDPRVTGATDETTCSPLPAGVVLNFPYHVRSHYFHLNVLKMVRRRVVIQYMRDDAAQVEQGLGTSMLAAGFSLHDRKQGGNGRVHIRYHKKGYGMAHIFLVPNDGGTDAIVKGVLTFDLPPPQFNPPASAPAGKKQGA